MKKSLLMKAGRVLLKRPVGSLSPETVLNELSRIKADNNNKLSPEAVIRSAKDKESPFHNQFTWDNKSAAHKWRIQEANEIIQAVVIQSPDGVEKPVYKVKVTMAPTTVKAYTEAPINDEEFVKEQVKNTLVSIWQRHKGISEYALIWKAVERQFDLASR